MAGMGPTGVPGGTGLSELPRGSLENEITPVRGRRPRLELSH